MICKHCGSTVEDNMRFCPYCGTAMTAPQPEAPVQNAISFAAPQPETPAQEAISFAAPQPEAPVREAISFAAPQPESTHAPVIPGFPTPTKKQKKKHPVAITLSIIAGILVIALVAGWLTNWFGFYGPAAKIYKAAEKTLDSGSFTIEITNKSDGHSETYTCEVEIDVDRRDLTIVIADENDIVTFAIYEGYRLAYYDYGDYGSGYSKVDMSDEIDDFFDAMEETKDFDLEDFLDEVGLLDRLEDYVDIDRFEKSAKSMYRNLNSSSWLKKNAGYSKEKENGVTVYTFNPNLYDLAVATLEEFENCFEDEDDYDDLMDGLDDFRKYLKKMDVTVSVGVKNGKLSSFEYSTRYNDGDKSSTKLEFINIGSTNIDEDLLDEIMDLAKLSSF